MSNLITLNFQHSDTVRIFLDENGTPLFVAKDVAKTLGYANTKDAIARHCKGVAKHHPLPTQGGTQVVRVIYEPDVYRLIFGSKLQSATQFQDWVFNEVLPSIRKTGTYTAPVIKPTNTITSQDVANIKHLVHLCGTPLHASGSARFAIHARLRELTGTTGGQAYTTEHLPLIADELVRIYHVLNQYGTKRRAIEADIIRHVIRGGRDEMLPALLDEMDKLAELRADSFFPTVDKLITEPVRRLLNRQ